MCQQLRRMQLGSRFAEAVCYAHTQAMPWIVRHERDSLWEAQ